MLLSPVSGHKNNSLPNRTGAFVLSHNGTSYYVKMLFEPKTRCFGSAKHLQIGKHIFGVLGFLFFGELGGGGDRRHRLR